jgi:hypothetical protein
VRRIVNKIRRLYDKYGSVLPGTGGWLIMEAR